MSQVIFEIPGRQARKWERYLREKLRDNIGERIDSVDFSKLCEVALYAFIAEEMEREARIAMVELERSMDCEKGAEGR